MSHHWRDDSVSFKVLQRPVPYAVPRNRDVCTTSYLLFFGGEGGKNLLVWKQLYRVAQPGSTLVRMGPGQSQNTSHFAEAETVKAEEAHCHWNLWVHLPRNI